MIKPARKAIASLTPYIPGKPIEELQRELGIREAIKLASNENPFGPSPRARRALAQSLAGINRYPDGSCFILKKALSAALRVPEDWIVFGNGSNEIIELLVRTFLPPGSEAVTSESTFLVYDLVVAAAGGKLRKAPLKNFTYDLPALRSLVNRKTSLVFIANPNNPTGTIVREPELVRFLRGLPKNILVVMDEAYAEFATDRAYPRSLKLLSTFPNLVALRTFSKVYGLAGLRIGYGVARPEVTDFLNRVRQPFNVSSVAQAAAGAALTDTPFLKKTTENNRRGLQFLYREFKRLGLRYVPTQANFVLFEIPGAGDKYYQLLLREGVIVRPMGGYRLPDWLRATVGLPRENARLIQALEKIISKN
jgi:histidinol-phosphate aminotransferase